MDLTLHPGEGRYHIRSVSAGGILINDQLYTRAVLVSEQQLVGDWAVTTVADIDEQALAPIIEMQPDLLLLGTGASHEFLNPQLTWHLLSRGIAVECMTTDAACRTFNVVMSEGRNAVAALLPLSTMAEGQSR